MAMAAKTNLALSSMEFCQREFDEGKIGRGSGGGHKVIIPLLGFKILFRCTSRSDTLSGCSCTSLELTSVSVNKNVTVPERKVIATRSTRMQRPLQDSFACLIQMRQCRLHHPSSAGSLDVLFGFGARERNKRFYNPGEFSGCHEFGDLYLIL